MSLLFLAALGAVVVGFVLQPIFARQSTASAHPHPSGPEREMEQLAESKARILASIKDLDFEHKAGKLSDPDYQRLRAEELAQAAEIMARMEEVAAKRKRAGTEAPVAPAEATEPAKPAEVVCPSCQKPSPIGAKFCLHCGARMKIPVKCPQCETELPAEARFCSECGQAVRT